MTSISSHDIGGAGGHELDWADTRYLEVLDQPPRAACFLRERRAAKLYQSGSVMYCMLAAVTVRNITSDNGSDVTFQPHIHFHNGSIKLPPKVKG